MTGKVEICGVNTARLKVLKNDETNALLLRVKDGDAKAREELIHGNLRLVLSVIQKFLNRGEQADDLFQVGCIGLMKAIDNFDTSLGLRFSTYGVPMIIGEIRRYLRDNTALRVSRGMRDTAYKAMHMRESLQGELKREPTIEELASAMGVPREDVVLALEASAEPISLYEPVYSDSGESVMVVDQIRDAYNTDEYWLEQIALGDAISGLSERERHILALRFYYGRTQMEVASEIGISQAQVSRLEKNAITRIKSSL
ncbi:MAG: RNA polymerase sporulation sigma factor SigG [Oscillospiraceae bacterium]|jgi:RNA polymerase sporulation-specific sigma factor|nr:RNA polymerase sporulation sigma factor SigG [Oscillospiraceae bacterium]